MTTNYGENRLSCCREKIYEIWGWNIRPKGAEMSDRQIAEYVGVSPPTVARYRTELQSTEKLLQSDTRTGRDGRTIDTSKIGATSSKVGLQSTREIPKSPTRTGRDDFQSTGQIAQSPARAEAPASPATERNGNTKPRAKPEPEYPLSDAYTKVLNDIVAVLNGFRKGYGGIKNMIKHDDWDPDETQIMGQLIRACRDALDRTVKELEQ